MKMLLKKKWIFIAKHYDFIIIDLVAFVLGYSLSLTLRRSLNIVMHNEDMLLIFGVIATVSYLIVEVVSENLAGVISRGLVQETRVIIGQMTITWTVYLSVLFLLHIIFALSRFLTIVSFLACTLFLLAFRTAWKLICKYSKLSDSVMPKLLIVTEASQAQKVLDRLVLGSMSKQYDICAVVMNQKSEPDYHDWYPHDIGLDKIDKYVENRLVQYAYVELNDKDEEKEIIDKLLDAGIIVHRSLGESVLQHADQSIGQFDNKSVITISGARASLISRADEAWQRFRRGISNAVG